MDLRSFTSSNRILYVLVVSIVLLVFLTVILILRGIGGTSSQSVTLQFWGVYDGQDAFASLIRKYEATHKNVKVIYRVFSYADYERELINALAAGSGPDIALIDHTWLAKHGDKLQPMPQGKISGTDTSFMTPRQFQEEFVDVTYADLVFGNQIYGLPLYVDTLAMYYNKDLLNSEGITKPPEDWEAFNENVEKMTRYDASGNIVQSGTALGTARNINRSTDILMLLMLQSGVQMVNEDRTSATFTRSVQNINVGEIALRYYTDFANPDKRTYSWNNSQHYSVDAFTEGTVGIMFNYAHQVDILRNKAPRLNFAVAPVPQAGSTAVTYANYWAPAVTVNSKAANEAWQFITYMTSRAGALDYLSVSRRPSARRDIIDQQKDDPDLGVFARQALTASSWFQADKTAIETIFADMIEKVNFNEATPRDALQQAESQVNVLMGRGR
jgi:multiple sugar transport system substrate-binding protein